ncbi:hypothetical protein [Chitinophaga sp. RAB17]|uniref:hypothetical protein n=1 Tax=Chitinophaga sp. RAB17 TaxID=3233049 RepID=UPI003F8DCDDD
MASCHPCFCYCNGGAGFREIRAQQLFPATSFQQPIANGYQFKKYFFVILKK